MIRSTIQRWLGGAPEAQPEPVIESAPDPRGAPGTRVYHEYFVSDEPTNGLYPWLCRVYAQNGAVNEESGSATTPEAAKNAALTYAAKTKQALRGVV